MWGNMRENLSTSLSHWVMEWEGIRARIVSHYSQIRDPNETKIQHQNEQGQVYICIGGTIVFDWKNHNFPSKQYTLVEPDGPCKTEATTQI